MTRSLTELTTDTNSGAWIPTEHYVDLILDGVQCYGDLSMNGITALEYDMSAGHGDTVNVRTVTKRSHSCATHLAGGCLSVTSNTLSNIDIQVYQMGDYDKIANFTEWKTFGNVTQAVANEMSKRLAWCRDSAIWTALCAATPNTNVATSSAFSHTRSIASVTCCIFACDLYNSIVSARQHLLGDCYNPDVVVLHPYAAAYLYYKDGASGMPDVTSLIKYNKDTGYMSEILGMRVIEARVAAADDPDPSTTGDELAFVMDSSRAIGEVFGQKPTFNQFYDGKCNGVELTVWQYWGTKVLDANAIVNVESA